MCLLRRHSPALSLLVLACAGALAHGQIAYDAPLPHDYPGVDVVVPGIFLTPVPNAPFSGGVEILSHEKLPDGTEHIVTARNHLARSSSGRIYQERHPLAAAALLGKTGILAEHIYDPSSRQSIWIIPTRHLARELTLRAPEAIPASALPPSDQLSSNQPKLAGLTRTDLGLQLMNGLQLHGVRKERTVPASVSGTGQPVVITDEYWYAEALSIYVIIRHNDPRTGEQLVAVTNVQRVEPPAEQFLVPPDYKVVDETTPQAPVAVR